MRIGVTGASGLVGYNFCKEALKKNNQLNILLRKDTDYTNRLKSKKFYGTLDDIKTLEKFCSGCEVIIHSAAMISIGLDSYDDVYKVNYLGTKNLLKACIKKNVKKFIFIGTVNAYNKNSKSNIFDESLDFVEKGSSYDVTKAKAQNLVLNCNELFKVSINPTSVLGKYDYKPSRLGKIVKTLYEGKLPFLVNGGLDVIDVEDLSKAIYTSINNGRDGESYLVSGKYRSFKEIYNSINSLKKTPSTVIFFPKKIIELFLPLLSLFPLSFLKRAAEINGKIFPGLENLTKESIENIINFPKNINNSKAKNELGLKISSLDKTVKDAIYR
tara:strand:+ start:515 stop:1498 length:984 start_codon:yes stop_codon:yes gene_type:complete